jgi:hypothetical protein
MTLFDFDPALMKYYNKTADSSPPSCIFGTRGTLCDYMQAHMYSVCVSCRVAGSFAGLLAGGRAPSSSSRRIVIITITTISDTSTCLDAVMPAITLAPGWSLLLPDNLYIQSL